MFIKVTLRRYFWFILLTLALVACAPVQTAPVVNLTDVQNTAIAIVGTDVAPTQAALPAAAQESMPTVALPTPSPKPTLSPPPILTPDTIQVEMWQDYQAELAKALFVYDPAFPLSSYGPDAYNGAICEWDVLGGSNQEVYSWAACISADGLSLRTNPAVIYLETDGSIQKVDILSVEVDRQNQTVTYDLHPFPLEVQEKLCQYYFYGFVPQCHDVTPAYVPSYNIDRLREGVFLSHLEYRKIHVEEPPLFVLSAMPMTTPIP